MIREEVHLSDEQSNGFKKNTNCQIIVNKNKTCSDKKNVDKIKFLW